VFTAGLSTAQEAVGSVPEVLRRPQRVDAPRYPRDSVIGELGAGELTAEHLAFATGAVRALVQGRERAAVLAPLGESHAADLVTQVVNLKPEKWRIGGGKELPDGLFSFLFRIIGGEGQIGGELYFAAAEKGFRLDDIALEDIPAELLDDDANRAYKLSPYERFF
jgi:hypothetical protein